MQDAPGFLGKLRQKRMVQVGLVYLGAAWVLLQLAISLEETLNLPDWVDQASLALAGIGFPLVIIAAWVIDFRSSAGEEASTDTKNSPVADSPPGRPSIAVLPFVNMSDGSDKEYFADGMTEDIITGLSLSKHLSVKSRTSTFGFKGQSPDIRWLGEELGVSYVVEGSIRPVADRVRISVQLIQAASGDHLWVEKFDRPAEQLFAIQDEVIASIVSALGANITRAETSRAASMKPSSLSAWEAVQRASFYRGADGNSEDETNHSIEELRTAVRDEPGYAYAHSMLAWILQYRVINGLTDDPGLDFAEASKHLQTGLALAGDDPFNLNICSGAFGYMGQWDKSEELCRRALAIDPNYADIYFNLGLLYLSTGRFDEAEEALDKVEKMAPGGPMSRYYDWYRANLRSMQCQYEAAERLQRSTIEKSPAYTSPYVMLAISLASLDRIDEAREVLARVLVVNPRLTLNRLSIIVAAHPDPEEGRRRMQLISELWPG